MVFHLDERSRFAQGGEPCVGLARRCRSRRCRASYPRRRNGWGAAECPGIGRGFRRAKAPGALTLISGPLTGTYLNLQGYNEVTLGRSQDCTLVLEDDFASGRHARLINRGSDWFIEDLDSRNGTWLNNQRIDQLERLSAGAEVRIGQTNVRMEA
nr:FHA domain-containing protein [Corynebacterium auriscanis]